MMSSDFRQIAHDREGVKAERLFRAAVSAFCSLTRPSRREIAQLEDLTLPLFDQVSVESRRYVAAALSECEDPPKALVRRLCDEPVEIAAPLLVRSSALSDVDLIALIGRHGLAHARAIARRSSLNPTLHALIRTMERPLSIVGHDASISSSGASSPPLPEPAGAGETVRDQLRSLMLPVGHPDPLPVTPDDRIDPYSRLLRTALTGRIVFFHTALADALRVDFQRAKAIAAADDYGPMLPAFRALDFTAEQAFLITAIVLPLAFSHPEAIRLFLERYAALRRDTALARVHRWRTDAVAVEGPLVAANSVPGEVARSIA